MLRDQSVTIKAGATEQLFIEADYLRIKKANIPFRFTTRNGDNFEIKQGDEVNITKFEYVYIKNESANDEVLEIYTGNNERVGSAELSGVVEVSNEIVLNAATITALNNGAQTPVRAVGANTQKTVTNASAQLVAANATRKYLLIQNKDLTGHIYINFGAAATTANGVKIASGGSFELNANILTGEIFAIGDIASNANIVVVEG